MTPVRLLILFCTIGICAIVATLVLDEKPPNVKTPDVDIPMLQPLTPLTPPIAPSSKEPTPVVSVAPSQQTTSVPETPDLNANPDETASLRMKIFFQKMPPRSNGFMVLTPREWRADKNSEFNPLLAKFKAPWAISLRKEQKEVIEINGLPKGSYQLLVYRNDGNQNRAPTLVHAVDISSGGYCNIEDPVLRKLEPVN